MSIRAISFVAAFCLALVVAGCAGTRPIDIPPDTLSSTAMAELDSDHAGERFLWGGVIVETRNLDKGTQIEVLSYPLDARQRPITSRAALGRFLIDSDDYLEPVDFAVGRQLSVYGVYERTVEGFVGEAHYAFPVLSAESLHLWHPEDRRMQPQFSIGVGFEL